MFVLRQSTLYEKEAYDEEPKATIFVRVYMCIHYKCHCDCTYFNQYHGWLEFTDLFCSVLRLECEVSITRADDSHCPTHLAGD